eukprot:9473515-Pyramimonas_sp.AAC.1
MTTPGANFGQGLAEKANHAAVGFFHGAPHWHRSVIIRWLFLLDVRWTTSCNFQNKMDCGFSTTNGILRAQQL